MWVWLTELVEIAYVRGPVDWDICAISLLSFSCETLWLVLLVVNDAPGERVVGTHPYIFT